MNAMTREHGQFYRVRIAGLGIVVIAVWGTLGMQAQALPEAAAISVPTAAIAVPAAVVVPAESIAAPTPTAAATPVSVRADVTAVAARADAAAAPAAAVATPGTSVELMVGQSTVLDVGAPITRVSLTSAEVADALVTSSKQLLLNGKTPGAISMFVWDRDGMLRRYDVVVQRDLTRLTEQISQLFPGESISAHSSGRNVVLSGSVTSKDVIDRAVNVAAGFTEKREEVVSLLQLASPPTNQVLLHVRFAEVSRSALTEVGASLFTSATGIHNTVGRVATQQFPSANFSDLSWSKSSSDFGSDVTSAEGKITFSDFLNLFVLSEKYDLGMLIKALQQKGLFQSLAEPNLVAESGKEASFLAGGEFPIPVAQGSGANIGVSVMFKEFGVRLSFTPQINGDRIHLKVKPEVSTLDFANAVQLAGFRIPALTTRRTETEIELRDRQTFAIAGLMNNSMTNTLSKIPGIGDIPVLGLLFKSKASQKNRTELVVMITPEILRADSPGAASALPKMEEPYLSPLPQNKSIAPPPPAFPVGAQGAPAQ
jgi:pilus assembly protein CpaC